MKRKHGTVPLSIVEHESATFMYALGGADEADNPIERNTTSTRDVGGAPGEQVAHIEAKRHTHKMSTQSVWKVEPGSLPELSDD